MPNLDAVLRYKNPKVVQYFCHHHPHFSFNEAEILFTDLLAWLWLNHYREQQSKKTYLFGPLLVLDDVWHTFILHTHCYFDFSMHYFGHYFHHEIEPVGEEHRLSEEELREFLADCFEHLGKDWVIRRFEGAFFDF